MKPAPTQKDLEELAYADFQHFVGKAYEVTVILGYVGEDSVERILSTPAKVIIQDSPASQMMSWCDGWLDTNYDVELAELHPELTDLRSMWIGGHSYYENGMQTQAASFKPLAQQ
jgi:hypothetical protein